MGGTTIATGTGTSGNGSSDIFVIDVELTCRTTGGSGTVSAVGAWVEVHGTGENLGLIKIGTTTINTTSSLVLDATYAWGTADAGNTLTSQISTVEVLN